MGSRRKGCKAKRVTRLSRLAWLSYGNRIEVKQHDLSRLVIRMCYDTKSTGVERLGRFPACMNYCRAEVQGLGARDYLATTVARHT